MSLLQDENDCSLQDKLENVEEKRMHFWSEAVAVGDEDWLKDEATEESGLKCYDILKNKIYLVIDPNG